MNSLHDFFRGALLPRKATWWLSCLMLMIWCSSCTKQVIADEQDSRTVAQAAKNQRPAPPLWSTFFEAEPWPQAGPLMGPEYHEFYIGQTQQPGYLHIANDNQYLYLSAHDANWQSSTDNLKIWIGLNSSQLPLGPNGSPQPAKFPVKHTVVPGTGCFTVQINFNDLASYLNLPPKSDRPAACETSFKLMVQADVVVGNKTQKAWAGDNAAGSGNNTYRWVSNYTSYCNIMPPPPDGNP